MHGSNMSKQMFSDRGCGEDVKQPARIAVHWLAAAGVGRHVMHILLGLILIRPQHIASHDFRLPRILSAARPPPRAWIPAKTGQAMNPCRQRQIIEPELHMNVSKMGWKRSKKS